MKLDGIRRIYLLGDLHIGIKNNSADWFNIQKQFIIDQFIAEIKANGFNPDTDILVQLGDWNHVRESTNVRISNELLDLFSILTDTFKRGIHIVLGNHDVYYKDRTDVHSLKEIGMIFNNVKIYEKPEILNINGVHKFLIMPWEQDREELTNKVKQFASMCDYMLCHADINDFKLNKWTKIENGIDRNVVKQFKHIYSGHIHIRQSGNNITYIGTPYQLDKGDYLNEKGYYMLEIEKDNIKESFNRNTISPVFLKIPAVDILNMNLYDISKLIDNNFVDILIDNDMAKVFPVSRFIDLLSNCNHRSIEFYPYSQNAQVNESTNLEVSYEYNMFEVLNEYLKLKEVPNHLAINVTTKFKKLYDDIKNNSNYYQQ